MTQDIGKPGTGIFTGYRSAWILFGVAAGVICGRFAPIIPSFIGKLEYARVSIPAAILLWFSIFRVMLSVDYKSLSDAGRRPRGLLVALAADWVIKPFAMYAVAWFFLKIAFGRFLSADSSTEYLAGALLLGAAPCASMIARWSRIAGGDSAYTVAQVAVNGIVAIFAFAPLAWFLLDVAGAPVRFDALLTSVFLFMGLPLAAASIVRSYLVQKRGASWFGGPFLDRLERVATVGLVIAVFILSSFQAESILAHPLNSAFIGVPLVATVALVFSIAYFLAYKLRIPHEVAAPAGMIGASSFLEFALAIAICVYGSSSGAALAAVVGLLLETPAMAALVRITGHTRRWFPLSMRSLNSSNIKLFVK